jgi:N4-bis(aminopropyl)spermidine synthase
LAEATRIVEEVAAAVGLREGTQGVRAVLAAVARLEPVATRRLSRVVELPVPIVASVCGELRKRGVVAEARPTQLTEAGRRLFAEGRLDIGGLGPRELRAAARDVAEAVRDAPPPFVELDQCHCTVETKLRRVVALHEADALVGKRVLLLGDDDLVSVALATLVRRHGSGATLASLTVLDLDERVLAFVEEHLAGASFPVTCVRHDLREPLASALHGAFDTVVTDPPYTVAAARLFLSRAADALEGAGGDVLFSFGSRRPGASFDVQQAIAELGFVIRRLERDFNEYVGAGVLGGTSHLYHLRAGDRLRPLIAGRFDGPLYTGEPNAVRSASIGARLSA